MLPEGFGVLVVALALVPGWLYLRLRERLRPPSAASDLNELLEVIAVGLLTTGTSAALLALLPHRWLPWLIDVEAWAREGNDHLRQHVRLSILSAGAVLGLALLITVGVHLLRSARSSDRFDPESSVWGKALGVRPAGPVPWVGLQMRNGQLVEGVLHSLSLGHGDQDERDIALARPIHVTDPGGKVRPVEVDRVIVPGGEILHINVVHVSETTGTPDLRWGAGTPAPVDNRRGRS